MFTRTKITLAAERGILCALVRISQSLPLVFAIFPRTASNIRKFGINLPDTVVTTPPLPYMEFLNLWNDAQTLLTDSDGLQEEGTALGMPRITLMQNTERPVTGSGGTNVLAGTDPARIYAAATESLILSVGRALRRPELWDGSAAQRIFSALINALLGKRT